MMVKVHTNDQKDIKASIFFFGLSIQASFRFITCKEQRAMMITKVENANVA